MTLSHQLATFCVFCVASAWFAAGFFLGVRQCASETPPPPIHPAPACYADCATTTAPTSPHDCALLAMTRIASTEGARLSRGHWRVARIVGEIAADCDEATALIAIARQESTWSSSAVSDAGACGITQVRSCDAPGTWGDMPCCEGYQRGGHHCRPTCEALMDTRTALLWTRDWLRDRGGWDPHRYVGARDPAIGAGYVERAEEWLRLAQGGAK